MIINGYFRSVFLFGGSTPPLFCLWILKLHPVSLLSFLPDSSFLLFQTVRQAFPPPSVCYKVEKLVWGLQLSVYVNRRDPDFSNMLASIGPSISLLSVMINPPQVRWHLFLWNQGPRRSDSLSCSAKHHSASAEVMFTYMITPCHLKYVMDTAKTIGIFKLQHCAQVGEISYQSLIGIILLMIESSAATFPDCWVQQRSSCQPFRIRC